MHCFSGVILTSVPQRPRPGLGESGVKQGSMAWPPRRGRWGGQGNPCSWSCLGPVRLGSLERCPQREGALPVGVPPGGVARPASGGSDPATSGTPARKACVGLAGGPRAQVRPARCRFLHAARARSLLPGRRPSLVGRRQSGIDSPRGPRVTCPAGFLRGAPGLATQQAPEGLGTLPGCLSFWKILQLDLWRRATPLSTQRNGRSWGSNCVPGAGLDDAAKARTHSPGRLDKQVKGGNSKENSSEKARRKGPGPGDQRPWV